MTAPSSGSPATAERIPRRAPIDTVGRILTPEGVSLELRIAGPAARGVAYAVDALIMFVVLVLFWFPVSWAGNVGQGLFLILLFVLDTFYFIFFEVLLKGQTPGKRACSLRVVSADGTPMSWRQSVVRNLLRPADQLPGLYAVGGTLMILSRRFQRLGDLAAGTLVVFDEPPAPPVSLPPLEEKAAAVLRWIPNAVKEDRSLRRAVALYARRRSRLSPTLRRRLAEPVVALLAERGELPADTDPDLVMRVLHEALWTHADEVPF